MKLKLLFLLLVSSTASFALELNYSWKPFTSYQFSAVQKDDISMSMMGMNMTDKFTTTVDFVVYIQSVDAEGTAKGHLFLINYSVKDSKGMPIASLKSLPKNSVQSAITVDKKGHFTFEKEVTLVTTATGNFLVYGKPSENGMSAGMESGTEKVDVYASFDPKTGKLKSGYTTTTMTKTKPATITTNDKSDELDVFPYDFLEMMIMPEGEVNQGDKYDVKAGFYNVNLLASSIVNNVVTFNETITTNKSQDQFSGAADVQTQDGMFNTGEIGGMGGIDLEPEDQEAMDITKSMSPDMNGNIAVVFDGNAGMFSSVNGTLNTSIDAMGMKMTIKSVLTMTKK
jgi:hypothetical protein